MVKCETCGFLALRNRYTGTLDEAPDSYRRTGWRPILQQPEEVQQIKGREYIPKPIVQPYSGQATCFAGVAHLGPNPPLGANLEIGIAVDPKFVLPVLQKERNCDNLGEWVKWIQGFTPKEHREMLDRQWQIETERKRRNSDRWWRVAELFVLVVASSLFTILGAQMQAAATERAAMQSQIQPIESQSVAFTPLASVTPTAVPSPEPGKQ